MTSGLGAVPDSGDDDLTVSAWTTVEARTTGSGPATPVTGGTGDLNVTWEADSTAGITWSWDPVAGETYEWKVVTADLDFAAEDPCGVTGFGTPGTTFSATSTTGPALLCVRTTDDGRRHERPFVGIRGRLCPWTAPSVGAITPAGDSGERTRALTWGGITAPANFRYDINIVVEGGGTKPAPTGADLQRACSAVSSHHESEETDVLLTGLNTTFTSSPQPYTGYLLCLRYANQRGETDWVAAADKHYTAPGRAPTPRKDPVLSTDDLDQAMETIVWNVASRGASDVPRLPAGYAFKVIEHPIRHDTDGRHGYFCITTTSRDPRPQRAGRSLTVTPIAVEGSPGTNTTSSGFTVTYSATRPTSTGGRADHRNHPRDPPEHRLPLRAGGVR